jgi:hypothetical protein
MRRHGIEPSHPRATAGGPAWGLIERSPGGKVLVEQAGGIAKTGQRHLIALRLLPHTAVTPAGRVVGPDSCAVTRREPYLHAVDEVLKAVAYALVARGHPPAAVTGEGFVLGCRPAGRQPGTTCARWPASPRRPRSRCRGPAPPLAVVRRWNSGKPVAALARRGRCGRPWPSAAARHCR